MPSTPATWAGTTPMMALDGYAARPPGTYSPTRPTGTWRVATIWPWGSTSRVAAGIEAAAVCRRLAASSWIASRTVGATSPRADSSSDWGTRRVVDVDAVEPPGQAPHRLVAALAHHPDHVGDRAAHLLAVLRRRPQAADRAVNVR